MKKAILAVPFLLVGGSAMAAIDPSIQTAFTEASTDASGVVGIITVALVLVVAAYWVKKAVLSGK